MAEWRKQDPGESAIIYQYPGGDVDIIAASDGGFRPPGWERSDRWGPTDRQGREAGKKAEGDDMLRSMRRARAKLRRLALANRFDYFVTLTLDQTKIDRYDPKVITKALNTWCDNMVRRGGLQYILVPERHKDGALHFHGFMRGDGLRVVASGHYTQGGPACEPQLIYNVPQWKFGFSTAIPLYGDYARAVAYVCKYIGKQEGQRPMGRWYYSGGGLAEPPKEYVSLEYNELRNVYSSALEMEIPGRKLLVIHTKKEENNLDESKIGRK